MAVEPTLRDLSAVLLCLCLVAVFACGTGAQSSNDARDAAAEQQSTQKPESSKLSPAAKPGNAAVLNGAPASPAKKADDPTPSSPPEGGAGPFPWEYVVAFGILVVSLLGGLWWWFSARAADKAAAAARERPRTASSHRRPLPPAYVNPVTLGRDDADDGGYQTRAQRAPDQDGVLAEVREMRASFGAEIQAIRDNVGEGQRQILERLDRVAASISGTLRRVEQDHDAVTRRIDVMQDQVNRLADRDLNSFFDEWNASELAAAHQRDTERTFEEFTRDTEHQRVIHECEVSVQNTIARARPWFDAITKGARTLELDSPDGGVALSSVRDRLDTYSRKGTALLREAEDALRMANFAAAPAGATLDMRMADVVTGRSAEMLSTGYRNQLIERLKQLQMRTEQVTRRWEELRDELLPILDAYYSVVESQAVAGSVGSIASLPQDGLRSALESANVNAIPIDPGRTPYDPTEHEAIGPRVVRAELPANTVVRVERRGFYYEGKVVRRALVALSTRSI